MAPGSALLRSGEGPRQARHREALRQGDDASPDVGLGLRVTAGRDAGHQGLSAVTAGDAARSADAAAVTSRRFRGSREPEGAARAVIVDHEASGATEASRPSA